MLQQKSTVFVFSIIGLYFINKLQKKVGNIRYSLFKKSLLRIASLSEKSKNRFCIINLIINHFQRMQCRDVLQTPPQEKLLGKPQRGIRLLNANATIRPHIFLHYKNFDFLSFFTNFALWQLEAIQHFHKKTEPNCHLIPLLF